LISSQVFCVCFVFELNSKEFQKAKLINEAKKFICTLEQKKLFEIMALDF
jgi:hypothetical protein